MPITLADHDAVIRDLFDKDKMFELTGDEGPIISKIRKINEWGGDHWRLPIQYATNQNVSASFARMKLLDGNNQFAAFVIDPYEYFGRVLFSRRFLKQAKGENAMVYVEGMENEWTGLLKTMVLERSFQFYGDGSACRGRFTTAIDPLRPTDVATDTAYLQDPEDSVYFYVGMQVGLSQVRTGGAARAGVLEVAGIEPETGMLTFTGNIDAGIAAAAAQDFVHRAGDYDAVMLGLGAWIPPVTPVPGVPFEGVDRAAHASALAGNRISVGTMTIAETLRRAASLTRVYGANSTVSKDDGGMSVVATVPMTTWNDLETELHAQGVRDFVHDVGDFGYSAIRMRTPSGKIDVYGDPFCPVRHAWLLDTKTWKIRSAGEMPEIIDDDGQRILREENANNFEGRAGWIAALGCGAPGNNCHINL
jgi:hypothetical protein